MDKEIKAIIDNMSYQELLSKWRFAPSGDPMFQGETGEYYRHVMTVKEMNKTQVSKNIGWGE